MYYTAGGVCVAMALVKISIKKKKLKHITKTLSILTLSILWSLIHLLFHVHSDHGKTYVQPWSMDTKKVTLFSPPILWQCGNSEHSFWMPFRLAAKQEFEIRILWFTWVLESTIFQLLAISSYKSKVGAHAARQWAYPKFISVLCDTVWRSMAQPWMIFKETYEGPLKLKIL